jgi:hypothetical protein
MLRVKGYILISWYGSMYNGFAEQRSALFPKISSMSWRGGPKDIGENLIHETASVQAHAVILQNIYQ